METIAQMFSGFGKFWGVTGAELPVTLEWGKSFVNKYATWIFALLFFIIFTKAFGMKVRA